MQRIMDANEVVLIGKLESTEFITSDVYGITFYNGHLLVERTSGNVDRIPICIKESVFEKISKETLFGKVCLTGYIITYNDETGHLCLSVQITSVAHVSGDVLDKNVVFLEATMCSKKYRETPFGRKITDMMLACNRYLKSMYIPTIAWGDRALAISKMDIGTKFCVKGRLQSRKYIKRYSDGNSEEKETYELSVSEYRVIK